MDKESNTHVTILRALVGPEDSYDLQLGPLHRIIVGLSNADFKMQLDLDPSRINDGDWLGLTPLMWSALRDNHTYLKILLLQDARVDLTDSEGRTALHHAARVGSLRCVEILLEAGIDPNIASLHDVTHIVANPEVASIVSSLHQHGADLEARSKDGWTPLYTATDLGSQDVVDALVDCGADVNALTFEDDTTIGRAIFRGNVNIVQKLCQSGLKSSWSSTRHEFANVLAEAALRGTVEVMDVLSDSDIAPVVCNVTKLKRWFNTYRDEVYGSRRSTKEELAAFHRLLDKKAIPLNHHESLELPVSTKDALDDGNNVDDCDDLDVFEDAVEYPSYSDGSGLLPASPVVVTS